MSRILIAGCGFTGTALGLRLAGEGHEVWGLRRRPEALPPAIRPLAADLTDPASLAGLPGGLDHVFYTASAGGGGEDAYRAAYVAGPRRLIEALRAQGQSPRRLFFTSSTAVYGQAAGEWVDEASPTQPGSFSGRLLLEGEGVFLGGPFPATVVRLAGIYGPGRGRLIESVRTGTARCVAGPPRYANRIHRDDAAGALRHLMRLPRPEALYIGADHEPAARCEVLRWLAERLGAPPPPGTPADLRSAGTPPPTVPPGGEEPRRARPNKRCANARLLGTGYRFRYPTYREGYAAILAGAGP